MKVLKEIYKRRKNGYSSGNIGISLNKEIEPWKIFFP